MSRCYNFGEDSQHFFVKDKDEPYLQENPMIGLGLSSWRKINNVGRQVQRWSDFDFEGPLRDGFAVDWPIRYKDLEKWYTK